MNRKKQTPWLLIGVCAAAFCLATLYFIRQGKPSTMESMQQPPTGIEQATAPAEESCVCEVTDPSTIDAITSCGKPCVIKFYATWCGACNHLASYFEEVAKEFKDKVCFYSINSDNAELMKKAQEAHLPKEQVQYLPTLVFFEEGKVHEQQAGAMPKDTLIEKIKTTFNV